MAANLFSIDHNASRFKIASLLINRLIAKISYTIFRVIHPSFQSINSVGYSLLYNFHGYLGSNEIPNDQCNQSNYYYINIIFFSLLDSDWLKSVPINP